MLSEPNLLRTQYHQSASAMLVVREITTPTNDPFHAPTLLRQLCLHLHLLVEPTLFLSQLSKTMPRDRVNHVAVEEAQ
jgi:hypothetical protein